MFNRINQIDELIAKTKEFDGIMNSYKDSFPEYVDFFSRANHWNKIFRGVLVNARSTKVEAGRDFLSPKDEAAENVFRTYIVPDLDKEADIEHLDNVFVDKCIIESWNDKYDELLKAAYEIKTDKFFSEPLALFKELFEIQYYSKYVPYAKKALDVEYALQTRIMKQTGPCSEYELKHKYPVFLEEMDELDKLVFGRQYSFISILDYEFDLEDTCWFNQFKVKAYHEVPSADYYIGNYARGVVDYARNEDGKITRKLMIYFDQI